MKSETSEDQSTPKYQQMKDEKQKKQQQTHKPLVSNNKKASMIISKCLQQNQDFKKFHLKKNWHSFHSSHYDWWAFPIDEISGHGQTYTVKILQLSIMKDSKQFMEALQSNARMVCEAWGYDLVKGQKIETQHQDQKWHNWPIRLYKMTKSLQIFGLQNLFKNAVKYGYSLIKDGKNFTYSKRELSKYFLEKHSIFFGEKIQKCQVKPEGIEKTNQPVLKNKKGENIIAKNKQQKSKF